MSGTDHRGFSLIETILVMAVMTTLIGIATISLLGSQRRATLIGVLDVLVADMRSQQTKAMTGATVNEVTPGGFGVYFESSRYVLFSGASYNPSDETNTLVVLPAPNTISRVGFPSNIVVFLPKSGEIAGYVSESDTITLQEGNSGQVKTIRLNRYGVVTRLE